MADEEKTELDLISAQLEMESGLWLCLENQTGELFRELYTYIGNKSPGVRN
jgi:hypothetical protein